ncbi:DUF333 domain-containing protein [Acrocarpospora catenulata]|uniref:DUF333 domain-containing protein n=1 Tax=Acrocarpospora catenulata TaxID=2836182 RepID=UPI001BDA72F6|nr:DUF333 domain-containing protein [Acrocarpospora catenulata]
MRRLRTLILSAATLLSVTHLFGPPTAHAATVSPAADWCRKQGGIVHDYQPRNPEAPMTVKPMCVFTARDGSRVLIGTETLSAAHATLAAVAYVNRPPMPATRGGGSPATAYCEGLGGKVDQYGWTTAAEPSAPPVGLCVFSDDSAIDEWGLAQHADKTTHGLDLTGKFRYRTNGTD